MRCTPSTIVLATSITTLAKVHNGKHGTESLMLFLSIEVCGTTESNTRRHDRPYATVSRSRWLRSSLPNCCSSGSGFGILAQYKRLADEAPQNHRTSQTCSSWLTSLLNMLSSLLLIAAAAVGSASAQSLKVVNQCPDTVFLFTQTSYGSIANNVQVAAGATQDMAISTDWDGAINVGMSRSNTHRKYIVKRYIDETGSGCNSDGTVCTTGGPTWNGSFWTNYADGGCSSHLWFFRRNSLLAR